MGWSKRASRATSFATVMAFSPGGDLSSSNAAEACASATSGTASVAMEMSAACASTVTEQACAALEATATCASAATEQASAALEATAVCASTVTEQAAAVFGATATCATAVISHRAAAVADFVLNKAATTIQAVQRGHMQRQRTSKVVAMVALSTQVAASGKATVSTISEHAAAAFEATAACAITISDQAAAAVEATARKAHDAAATVIQKVQRGHMQRQRSERRVAAVSVAPVKVVLTAVGEGARASITVPDATPPVLVASARAAAAAAGAATVHCASMGVNAMVQSAAVGANTIRSIPMSASACCAGFSSGVRNIAGSATPRIPMKVKFNLERPF